MVAAARTLLAFTTVVGVSLLAGCTSGTTANCSPDAAGMPDSNPSAWCGVPAGDASEIPDATGPTETGTTDSPGTDSAPETGPGPDAAPEAATDGGGTGTETGSPEAATDAPPG